MSHPELQAIAHNGITFIAADGRAFVRMPNRAGGYQALPVRSTAYRNWFNGHCLDHDQIPSAQAFSSICRYVEARAAQADEHYREILVGRRIGGALGRTLTLDLVSPQGHYVAISSESWEVTNREGFVFERSRSAREMPAPLHPDPAAATSPLETLHSCLNLPDRADWLRCLAWLISALVPGVQRPILAIQGPNSSGKSTLARFLRNLVDPCTAVLQPLPTSVRALRTLARFQWVQAFDRVSTIPAPIADALSCLSSGAGVTFRESAADPEPVQQSFSRPILFTTAHRWTCPDDLIDRLLPVTLPAIAPESQYPDSHLTRVFNDSYPQILGALCDAVSTAMRNLPATQPALGVPYADAATWAIAAAPALGCTEDEMRQALRIPAMLTESLQAVLGEAREWEGPAAELQTLVPPHLAGPTPKCLSERLNQSAADLIAAGIQVTHSRRGGVRRLHLQVNPCAALLEKSPDSPNQEQTLPSCEAGFQPALEFGHLRGKRLLNHAANAGERNPWKKPFQGRSPCSSLLAPDS